MDETPPPDKPMIRFTTKSIEGETEEKPNIRLLKQIEKKTKAAERKRETKRQLIQREVKCASTTLQRYEKKWRQMLIDISIPKMHQELEYAWQNFERIMDCKDFTISLLMDEVRESEEQYMSNIKNHVDNVDKLIQLFHDSLEELEENNKKYLREFQRDLGDEIESLTQATGQGTDFLKTVLFGLEIARKKQEQFIQIEYFSKLNAEETNNHNIIQRLRAVLERKHLRIWEQTKQFLKNYLKKTKERKVKHDELKLQDDAMQAILVAQLRKLHHSHNFLKKLKTKYLDSQKIWGEKVSALKTEHDYIDDAFITLKNNLIEDKTLDMRQMITLTTHFNETLDSLRAIQKKAEHILHLTTMCRKLQTVEEKVLPFPVAHREFHPITASTSSYSLLGPDQYGHIPLLDLFWQQVGQAEAAKISIQEELEYLKTENNELKLKLHEFCQCVQCPTETNTKVLKHFTITDGVAEMEKYVRQSWNVSFSRTHSSIDR